MPVLLQSKIYQWLAKIQVFRSPPLPSRVPHHCEVPYDQQIYLQNGYLIGVTLRKFVTPYSAAYQQLWGVRKIATLKSSDNWHIIEPYLAALGCHVLEEGASGEGEVDISVAKIAEILEQLYLNYCPPQEQKVATGTKRRLNYIDFYKFDTGKDVSQAENSLELFVLVLVNTFNLELAQALGLLVDQGRNLKRLIIEGSKIDDFEPIKNMYAETTRIWQLFEQFFTQCPKDAWKILQILSEGVLSQSTEIINASINLLSFCRSEQWFLQQGYYKILCSRSIQAFYFVIEKLSPKYSTILNQNLHSKIANKHELFAILSNLARILPKTIYCKEVLNSMPVIYFFQQCYSVLNADDIEDQPRKLVGEAKELLYWLLVSFWDRLPHAFLPRVNLTLGYRHNRSPIETYHLLSLLFQVTQVHITRESPYAQSFFVMCVKYLQRSSHEIKIWVAENLSRMLTKLRRGFPVGLLARMYTCSPIAQESEYRLFDLIADESSALNAQQCSKFLTQICDYIQNQIHCQCFLNIYRKIVKTRHSKNSQWAQNYCKQLLQKMNNMNVPTISTDVLNPKPPSKTKVVHSIGLKRKQMIKFRQYEIGKRLAAGLVDVRDKKFLTFYYGALLQSQTLLQKQLGQKKTALIDVYKSLKNKIRLKLQQIENEVPMDDIVRSILLSRSKVQASQSSFNPGQQGQEQQGQMAQSRYMKQNKHQPIPEEQDEDNQFITDSFAQQGPTQNIQQQPINELKYVLPFTEECFDDDSPIYYSNQLLQQPQIIFINALRQTHDPLLVYCTHLYQQLLRNHSEVDQICAQLLQQTGIPKLISSHEVQQLLMRCRLHSSDAEETVFSLLVQIGMHVFGFGKSRRVAVACLPSFFTLLGENLREEMAGGPMRKKQNRSVIPIFKSIEFKSNISPAVTNNNPAIQAYLICFSALSEILSENLGLNLIQPISIITTRMVSNTQQQSQQPTIEQVRSQLEILEQQLTGESQKQWGSQDKIQAQRAPKVASRVASYRLKRQGKRASTEAQQQPSASAKAVNHQELREKIAKRLRLMAEESKKGRTNQAAKQ